MSNRKTSTIESIGKFGLIERLTNNLSLTNPHSVLGVGDDSAILELSDKESLLLTTDLLVEGIHSPLPERRVLRRSPSRPPAIKAHTARRRARWARVSLAPPPPPPTRAAAPCRARNPKETATEIPSDIR